jgi:hypothetical protein
MYYAIQKRGIKGNEWQGNTARMTGAINGNWQ